MDHKRIIVDLVRSADDYESRTKSVEVLDGSIVTDDSDVLNNEDQCRRSKRIVEVEEE